MWMRDRVLLERVERAIERVSGVPVSDMRGKCRRREQVNARHAVWYVSKKLLGIGYTYLAELCSWDGPALDHTTVMYGVQRMQADSRGKEILAYVRRHHPEIESEAKMRPKVHWNLDQ